MARAISTVENRAPDGRAAEGALSLTAASADSWADRLARSGQEHAGRSTGARTIAKQNRTVGIIAVDPTSPYTGGAILGDRIRMQDHFADPGIYIRSMATRGSLGGLARTTADVATVLDASGRDLVMIETVGVGQDEVDIVRLADVTVVILVPGMGDDVQTIKAGIMEIADIFVINKSDREGAERVEREIRAMQSLAMRSDNWTPPIVKTVASEGYGHPGTGGGDSRLRELICRRKIWSAAEACAELAGTACRDVARCLAGKSARAVGRWRMSRATRRSGRAQARSVFAGGRDCGGTRLRRRG